MGLTENQILKVETVLRNSLRHKFKNYKPEPAAMPFHTRLLVKTEWLCSHLSIH